MPFYSDASRADTDLFKYCSIILIVSGSWHFLSNAGLLVSKTFILLLWEPINLVYCLSFFESQSSIVVSRGRAIANFLYFCESLTHWGFGLLFIALFPKIGILL